MIFRHTTCYLDGLHKGSRLVLFVWRTVMHSLSQKERSKMSKRGHGVGPGSARPKGKNVRACAPDPSDQTSEQPPILSTPTSTLQTPIPTLPTPLAPTLSSPTLQTRRTTLSTSLAPSTTAPTLQTRRTNPSTPLEPPAPTLQTRRTTLPTPLAPTTINPTTMTSTTITLTPLVPTLQTPTQTPPATEALTPADDNQIENVAEYKGVPDTLFDADKRPELSIIRGPRRNVVRLEPYLAHRNPRVAFRNSFESGAMRWKLVSKGTKDFYYGEFGKPYKWKRYRNDEFRAAWDKVAGKCYREWISDCKKDWRKGKGNLNNLKPEDFKAMVEYWNRPDVRALSERNAANHRGGAANGEPPATHTGGSKPHYVHTLERARVAGGKMPTHKEMYVELHSSGGTHCNDKVVSFEEKFNIKKGRRRALCLVMMRFGLKLSVVRRRADGLQLRLRLLQHQLKVQLELADRHQ